MQPFQDFFDASNLLILVLAIHHYLNALTKITPKERNKLLKDLYNKAVQNVKITIGQNRNFTEEELNNLYSCEADRLLKLYNETH